MTQSCKTCKWSRWWLTPSGKLSRDTMGQCRFPLPVIVLPDSVKTAFGFSKDFPRRYMDQNDGTDCPCWEKNEGKLISESVP